MPLLEEWLEICGWTISSLTICMVFDMGAKFRIENAYINPQAPLEPTFFFGFYRKTSRAGRYRFANSIHCETSHQRNFPKRCTSRRSAADLWSSAVSRRVQEHSEGHQGCPDVRFPSGTTQGNPAAAKHVRATGCKPLAAKLLPHSLHRSRRPNASFRG